MVRPSKFTPHLLKRIHTLHFKHHYSYKRIQTLLTNEGVHTTIGSLKVKMSNFNKQPLTGDLLEKIAALEARLTPLESSSIPNMSQSILSHLNGTWYSYRDLSEKVFGNDREGDRVRKCLTSPSMKKLIETDHVYEDRHGQKTRIAIVRLKHE